MLQFSDFPEFPGIFSFPGNYLENFWISQNSGNFLQSGNTACKALLQELFGLLQIGDGAIFSVTSSFFCLLIGFRSLI